MVLVSRIDFLLGDERYLSVMRFGNAFRTLHYVFAHVQIRASCDFGSYRVPVFRAKLTNPTSILTSIVRHIRQLLGSHDLANTFLEVGQQLLLTTQRLIPSNSVRQIPTPRCKVIGFFGYQEVLIGADVDPTFGIKAVSRQYLISFLHAKFADPSSIIRNA